MKTEPIVAIQLRLETTGWYYEKWGHAQVCRSGDWLVEDTQGEVYTVCAREFERTYQRVSPGIYQKKKAIWAEPARANGTLRTLEGHTDYAEGDFILYAEERSVEPTHAVTAENFRKTYRSASD